MSVARPAGPARTRSAFLRAERKARADAYTTSVDTPRPDPFTPSASS